MDAFLAGQLTPRSFFPTRHRPVRFSIEEVRYPGLNYVAEVIRVEISPAECVFFLFLLFVVDLFACFG
jgi:hypothetical protein